MIREIAALSSGAQIKILSNRKDERHLKDCKVTINGGLKNKQEAVKLILKNLEIFKNEDPAFNNQPKSYQKKNSMKSFGESDNFDNLKKRNKFQDDRQYYKKKPSFEMHDKKPYQGYNNYQERRFDGMNRNRDFEQKNYYNHQNSYNQKRGFEKGNFNMERDMNRRDDGRRNFRDQRDSRMFNRYNRGMRNQRDDNDFRNPYQGSDQRFQRDKRNRYQEFNNKYKEQPYREYNRENDFHGKPQENREKFHEQRRYSKDKIPVDRNPRDNHNTFKKEPSPERKLSERESSQPRKYSYENKDEKDPNRNFSYYDKNLKKNDNSTANNNSQLSSPIFKKGKIEDKGITQRGGDRLENPKY